jgi:hypothetical protein
VSLSTDFQRKTGNWKMLSPFWIVLFSTGREIRRSKKKRKSSFIITLRRSFTYQGL